MCSKYVINLPINPTIFKQYTVAPLPAQYATSCVHRTPVCDPLLLPVWPISYHLLVPKSLEAIAVLAPLVAAVLDGRRKSCRLSGQDDTLSLQNHHSNNIDYKKISLGETFL